MFTNNFDKTAGFGSADESNGDYKPKQTRDDKRAISAHDVDDLPTSDTGKKKAKIKKAKDETGAKKAANGETLGKHVTESYPDFPGSRKEAEAGNVYENSTL